MDNKIKFYLQGKRSGWIAKLSAVTNGNQRVIDTRMIEIAMDRFTGDPNSFRTCAHGCGENEGWSEYSFEDKEEYHICSGCGGLQMCRLKEGDVAA